MDYKINYELTAKIEIINEFSFGVYNHLMNYVLKNELEKSKNLYSNLLATFEDMLSTDLEPLDAEELEKMLLYWKTMDHYVKEITTKKQVA
ncbi:hypothetical protein [Enterococcus sp. AZ196]|uniref:hypothetical protein n=1 Tax=Enterococcus sp. AZ196 TaxID=2774659 RepID=UPI003D2E36AA